MDILFIFDIKSLAVASHCTEILDNFLTFLRQILEFYLLRLATYLK